MGHKQKYGVQKFRVSLKRPHRQQRCVCARCWSKLLKGESLTETCDVSPGKPAMSRPGSRDAAERRDGTFVDDKPFAAVERARLRRAQVPDRQPAGVVMTQVRRAGRPKLWLVARGACPQAASETSVMALSFNWRREKVLKFPQYGASAATRARSPQSIAQDLRRNPVPERLVPTRGKRDRPPP